MKQTIIHPDRITSIDALRGIALSGILIWHCIEHFDLSFHPVLESPFWQSVDNVTHIIARFLFQGKAYAIFSLLFGLSFFIQMDSQAQKGNDFRLRFLWRLIILFAFGYINGLIYMGEFFVIYATLGMILIPLYNVSTKWLIALCVLLFLQIPQIIDFISLINNNIPNKPNSLHLEMYKLFDEGAKVFINGSLCDVFNFNLLKGQTAKVLWFINVYRYLQLAGLFISGMLIGRSGIHKDKEKMVQYSKIVLPYAFAWFAFFYLIVLLLPLLGVEDHALQVGTGLFTTYSNLGLLMVYVSGLTLLYYKTDKGRKIMDMFAPVGRMSVTNYMMQSVIGLILFYGFGFNLAIKCSYLQCVLIGITICIFQLLYSNYWMKRYYYGPVEWLWRTLTWFKPAPLRRVN